MSEVELGDDEGRMAKCADGPLAGARIAGYSPSAVVTLLQYDKGNDHGTYVLEQKNGPLMYHWYPDKVIGEK